MLRPPEVELQIIGQHLTELRQRAERERLARAVARRGRPGGTAATCCDGGYCAG
ncbi:hypothetical protein LIP_0543 [Limnochorda pilosa]|uniref:Uncharacterized protein n=1 Tax=Limnochorda pilosa TaxID=1555112 RepID=A0A0K2SH35_LIMPI|nr:hypothetical protein LIP_0543 [Limnochorda pilosa]